MSPTEEQQDWVDRNLFGGAKAQKQKSAGLVAFKNELAADQSGQQGLSKDFEVICSLFTRLPTIIEGAANIESLSKVFQVSTAGSGSDDGRMQGSLPREFDIVVALVQKAIASVIAEAPSDSLSQLAELSAGPPDETNVKPISTHFTEIATAFKELQTSAVKSNPLSALSELSDLQGTR